MPDRACRAMPILAALLLAACVAPNAPSPPAVEPDPAPPTVALPPPAPVDWRDAPLTPGRWTYTRGKDGSIAAYGQGGAPVFTVQCAAGTREVSLFGPAAQPAAQVRLTTSYGATDYPAGTIPAGSGWRLAGRDPALDRIAFSRGRFMVEGLGPRLILPAWAEVARVVEDCR